MSCCDVLAFQRLAPSQALRVWNFAAGQTLEGLRYTPLPKPRSIVLTSLKERAMPLIRYRTGDLARLIEAPCACGAAFPRLGRVEGRLGDGVTFGDGVRFDMGKLDELLGEIEELSYYEAEISTGELVISAYTPVGLDRIAPRVEAALAPAGIAARLREMPIPDIRLTNRKRTIREI